MHRTRLASGLAFALALIGFAPPAPAQTTATAARPTPPYSGFINADLVNIRCGPGPYFYPLVQAAKNTPVVVESESRDWLALRPLTGACGLVAKNDVKIAADGATATLASPAARVYASGPAARRQWCVMPAPAEGATFQVLGPAEGDRLRVAPPEGARVYVLTQYVTPGASLASPGPIESANIEPPKLDPLAQAYKDAGAALAEEMKKPVDERDYAPALAQFADIADKAEKNWLKAAASRRAAEIQALVEQQNEFRATVAIGSRLDQRLTELDAQRTAAMTAAEREAALQKPPFLATGVVAPMESLEGVDHPIKFKLVDQRGRPVVVLQSTLYDLNQYAGKAVGVRGTRTYLPDWATYLVTVDDLEVLE
jgi:SH3-like domain-containing protein